MSFKKLYEARRRKEAIGTLKQLADRIKNGELELLEIGLWRGGVDGRWNFKMVVQEKGSSTENSNS